MNKSKKQHEFFEALFRFSPFRWSELFFLTRNVLMKTFPSIGFVLIGPHLVSIMSMSKRCVTGRK